MLIFDVFADFRSFFTFFEAGGAQKMPKNAKKWKLLVPRMQDRNKISIIKLILKYEGEEGRLKGCLKVF